MRARRDDHGISELQLFSNRPEHRARLNHRPEDVGRDPQSLKKVKGPNGAVIGVVCFKDPDGTILELISGM